MFNYKKTPLIILTCIIFYSCASTPQSRIKEKEKEFIAAPQEVQGQIQSGEISKGFSEDQVYMSKGKPGEVIKNNKGGKFITTWKYFGKPDVVAPKGSAPTGFSGAYEYPTPGAGAHKQPYPMIYSKPKLVIEFEDGKVSSWKENP